MSEEENGNDLRELLTQEVEKSSSAPLESTNQAAEPLPTGAYEPPGTPGPAPSASSTEELGKEGVKPVESTHPKEEDELAFAKEATAEEIAAKQRLDRPPQSWKAEAKKSWGTLPLEARQEIQRREADTQGVLRENATSKQFISQMEQIVNPHLGWMQASGVKPMDAINNMLAAENIARSGTSEQKVSLAVQYLIDYGIDLAQLDTALSKRLNNPQAHQAVVQQDAQQDAMMRMMQQELAPMRNFLAGQQQAEQQALHNEVDAFASTHEFIEDLRVDMAVILDAAAAQNRSMGLEQAYNIAMAGRPDIAQAASMRSRQANSTSLRAAASSVTGSSGMPVSKPNDPKDLKATLEAMWGD